MANQADSQPIIIEIFSDILCVWAYGSQTRIDQLQREFGEQVLLKYRFIPLFASTDLRVVDGWKDKGGTAGFNAHTHEVVSDWSHLSVHPDLWITDRPPSSTIAHTYLKALQLLQQRDQISDKPIVSKLGRSLFEEFMWRTRCRFFEHNRNIALRETLDELAVELDLPISKIHDLLENGEADAALHGDIVARDKYLIPGSPTLVLNKGRQRLYGNVSYRIIETNVKELLADTRRENASSC